MDALQRNLQSLKMVHIGMVAAVVVYAVLGEFVLHVPSRPLGNVILILAVIASSMLSFAYTIRNSTVAPAAENLRENPHDAAGLLRWRQANVVVLMLCEGVGLVGFILRALGGPHVISLALYAISIVYLFILAPRRP